MLSSFKCTQRCLKVTGHTFQRGLASRTHYEVLKVHRTASAAQIKQAYIQRCKELHPDTNRHDPQNHNKFVRLNEAYSILSKRTSKSDYDRKLDMGINVTESYYPPPSKPAGPRPDEYVYNVYSQRYYGASREERAQRERDYYRRAYEEKEKELKNRKTDQVLAYNWSVIGVSIAILLIVYQILNRRWQHERDYWRRSFEEEKEKGETGETGEKERKIRKISPSLITLIGLSMFITGFILQRNELVGARTRREYFKKDPGHHKTKRKQDDERFNFNLIFISYRVVFMFLGTLYILRHNWHQRHIKQRERNVAERVYFASGSSYPRPRRRRRPGEPDTDSNANPNADSNAEVVS